MIPYTLQGCRFLLQTVEALHKQGYQRIRAVPILADSAGGGRWWCWLVPAEMTSDRDGAQLKENLEQHIREHFPCFPIHRSFQDLPYPASADSTALLLREKFPELAKSGMGEDVAYASWFSEMMRQTTPLGLFIGSQFAEQVNPLNEAGLRVVGGESEANVVSRPPVAQFK